MFHYGGKVVVIILTILWAGFFCSQNIKAVDLTSPTPPLEGGQIKVNINTATVAELDTLPEIGPVLAQRIIDYRLANGNFLAIEDIMKVSGIKSATFEKIKNLITVGDAVNTQVCGNGTVEANEQCDDGNLVNGDGCDNVCKIETSPPPSPLEGEEATAASSTEDNANPPNPLYPAQGGQKQGGAPVGSSISFGDVVINEFVPDPGDNETEWIELYNKTAREIDLSGWKIEDGSKAKTALSGIMAAADNGKYKIIKKPAGNLNNGGDIIILFDPSGKLIDQVAYGNWADGNLTDNAPAASDPASVARKFDGYNTFNNYNDFAVTLKPSKGESNIIQTEGEVSEEAKAKFDFSSDVLISEILPNPKGDDVKGEFIEIYNAGEREVNLTGWSLANENDKKFYLEKIAAPSIIKAHEYLAFYRLKTKIVLHNDSGAVKLFQPLAEKAMQIVEYEKVKEGWSYNNINANFANYNANAANIDANANWIWSEMLTPDQANIIKTINRAPEAEFSFPENILVSQPIIFDSSDTSDIDGDNLKYEWDFNDGLKNTLANPEHTFFKPGVYRVKLTVSDGKETGEKEKSVKVADINGENITPQPSFVRRGTPSPLEGEGWGEVIINEIYPNPKGADAGEEWIELKNQSQEKINLLNWRVENSNGRYEFKNELWLEAEKFYLLNNAESKLAFKNSSDVISLYNSEELIDEAKYLDALEGAAYGRGQNGKWFWTTKLTPGADNIISLAQNGIMNPADVKALAGKNELRIREDAENYEEIDLDKVRELEIGELVKAKGIVAVEPGVLGTQFFYLISYGTASASAGLQVYNYKKNFPLLKLGDYVEAAGELSQAQDELRIKTGDKNDIKVIEHQDPPLALALSPDNISEENIGQLIAVSGEITGKKAYTVYLDDGHGEILVYFKKSAGLDIKNLQSGQAVSITGILSKAPGGLRLLPRYQTDIIKTEQLLAGPQVLGEVVKNQDWALAERNKKLELFKYLLIIAGAATVILAGLYFRAVKKR